MEDNLELVLKHMRDYLKLYHSKDDGGVHINLIARINEQLAQLDKPERLEQPEENK